MPDRVQLEISGDLEELFDQFPTPMDDFMLQIQKILYKNSKLMKIYGQIPNPGNNYVDKLLQIPTHCPTWSR